MPVTLRVPIPDGDPEVVTIDGARIVLGRGQGCDIRLPDASVSQRHASIRAESSGYVVVDEGSTNGTYVGGIRVPAHTGRLLRSGDRIVLGCFVIEVRLGAAPMTSDMANVTRDIAFRLVEHALRQSGHELVTRLRIVEGPGFGAELALTQLRRVYRIGRGELSDLVLSDPDASREHFEVVCVERGVFVRDCGSHNGTWLGSQRLVPMEETPWRVTLAVRAAKTVLACEEPIAMALAELETLPDRVMDPPTAAVASTPLPNVVRPLREQTPASRLPPVKATRPSRGMRRAWGAVDIVVLGIGFLVLAASMAGLVWVFRSG